MVLIVASYEKKIWIDEMIWTDCSDSSIWIETKRQIAYPHPPYLYIWTVIVLLATRNDGANVNVIYYVPVSSPGLRFDNPDNGVRVSSILP
jgi:hypothetical protein